MSEKNPITVVIVGGGVAGLSAAKELADNRIDFVLLEAQDYLGGRVRTIEAAPDLHIDLGAQYILGDTNNVVHTICKQLNCIADQDEKEDLYLSPDGSRLEDKLIEKIWQIREQILEDAQEKSKNSTSQTQISLLQHLKESYAQKLNNSVIDDENLRGALIVWLLKLEEVDIGCQNLNDVRLAQCDTTEQLEKSSLWKLKYGFRTFIDYLRSAIPKNQMRLSSEVTKVAFDDSDHILTVELVNQLDGNISNLTCNHVIWTTSVGYLKENFQKIFSSEPDLIHQKQSSIENLGFGTANKVILVYDAPISFWPDNTADLHPLISVNQTKYSLNKGERAFLTEQNVDPSQAQFVLDGVLCVSPSVSMRFVIVWIVGEAALAAESFNELVLAYLCHNIFLSRYLNGAVDNQKPSRAIMSYWNKNRFERGSYSYLSVRASLDDRDRLRQSYTPDGIPRVVFAGEATHSHYSSSVHGAYESGINAVQILRQYLETASDCRK